MGRIIINLPEKMHFETDIPVRITDINYGGHVGNEIFLSIIHEARVQFLNHFRFSELDVDGVGLIMSDAALVFKEEVFYGAVLKIKIYVDNISAVGCDFFYRICDAVTGNDVAKAKTGIVFFDYSKRKIAETPEKFKSLFSLDD